MANLKKYGLTLEQHEAMKAKSNNTCYICGKPPTNKKALHIDHNHKTGQVRGLLCFLCNRYLIGKMGDEENCIQLFLKASSYLAGKPILKKRKQIFKFSTSHH